MGPKAPLCPPQELAEKPARRAGFQLVYIEGWVQEGPKYKIAVVEESENKNSICNIKSGPGQMVL